MRNRRLAVTALLTPLLATALFYLVEHQISSTLLEASLRPEVRAALEQSMADQKHLRAVDPPHADEYRRRFNDMHRLAARLDIIRLSRAELLRRYELVLAGAFAVVVALAVSIEWARRRREERRLALIQSGLKALSLGESAVTIADDRRDLLGRIGRMIEETARVVSRQRRRIDSLQHLSSWQEAARRHAHEIRTPVTAARLEVERLASLGVNHAEPRDIDAAKESALEELDRLARYTAEFSSFAKLPQPVLRPEKVDEIVDEFCRAFGGAWPNLVLDYSNNFDSREAPRSAAASAAKTDELAASESPMINADRDMLRQVFANLCANSSLAVNGRGKVIFSAGCDKGRVFIDISDNGGGIDASLRPRLFQPYATTRRVGEGMGLGLAISRKIMLDHDGDLELVASGDSGTTFRLTFPPVDKQPPRYSQDSGTT